MISQTAQFTGCSASRLCRAYLSSADHAAMTVDGTMLATYFRPSSGDVPKGRHGDELRAFGMPGPDGDVQYSLKARILELIPDRLIVLSWRNKAFDLAVNASDISDLASTVVLTFRDNVAGAEIRLDNQNATCMPTAVLDDQADLV